MVQKIFALGMGGSGIVAVLIIAGVLLLLLDISPQMGNLSLTAGIIIGIILGVFGVMGVARRF